MLGILSKINQKKIIAVYHSLSVRLAPPLYHLTAVLRVDLLAFFKSGSVTILFYLES